MRAEIIGTDDESIGVRVYDNNGAQHAVAVGFAGGVIEQGSDEYPDDPKERTNSENEHVNQAARYAKYYVYREREYDTLTPYENPDRIATLALIVQSMSVETFEEYFDDLYQQVRSHHTGAQRARHLPDGITQDDVLFYRQHVYLGLDEADARNVASFFDEDGMQTYFEEVDSLAADVDDRSALQRELQTLAEDLDREINNASLPDDLWIDAVSDIHVRWDEGLRERIDRGDDPRECDPDVRLEVFPLAYEPDTLEEFQHHLVHHLKCQVRDCYIGMGLIPPESVQLTGPGIYKYSNWYQHYDIYQPYHDPDADIDWTVQGPLPTH